MTSQAHARIAIATMTSGIDPKANLAKIRTLARDASEKEAAMLFLPEMAVLLDRDGGRSAPHVGPIADNPLAEALAAIARDHGIWMHAGSLPMRADGTSTKRLNRTLVFDEQGAVVAGYDKMHLFDVDLPSGERWRESDGYDAGDRIVVVDTPVGRLGLTICYDLRFGRLFDRLADAGAEMIAVPAAFTVPTGKAHWHVLLRARAIETGAFIIAAAQRGDHADGRSTYGHSLVVDPWGHVLFDGGDSDLIGIVDLDLALVTQSRQALPTARHRRVMP